MDLYASGRSVTWLGIGFNAGLVVVKIVVGWLSSSRALVADGFHSLADLSADFTVLIGMKVAVRPPDERHPYGHHKAANIAGFLIASALLIACVLLVVDGVRGLRAPEPTVPHFAALLVALASVATKEFLYRRTRKVAEKSRSRLLLVNAWHHRTDGITSLGAAIGIGLAIVLGPEWAFLDAFVAILLAVWLGVEGLRLLRGAVDDLMDTTPGRSVVDDLREHILGVDGAIAYHDFRARRVGDMVEVDFHLLVDASLTVEVAHEVAHRVQDEIMAGHPEVLNVLIHVEPALPEHHRQRGVAGGSLDAGSSTDTMQSRGPRKDAP